MAHWSVEADLSGSWMHDSITSFNATLSHLEERFHDPRDWFYIDALLSESEQIFGIVACIGQTYITHFMEDLRSDSEMGDLVSKIKWELISQRSSIVVETSVCVVELIYHLGNYWKHGRAWPDWEENPRNKNTIRTLAKAGISKDTDYPCVRAFEHILPHSASDCLSELPNVLMTWRSDTVAYLEKEGMLS